MQIISAPHVYRYRVIHGSYHLYETTLQFCQKQTEREVTTSIRYKTPMLAVIVYQHGVGLLIIIQPFQNSYGTTDLEPPNHQSYPPRTGRQFQFKTIGKPQSIMLFQPTAVVKQINLTVSGVHQIPETTIFKHLVPQSSFQTNDFHAVRIQF